jgi:flagellar motility protein MotE (MotC chaperone)
MSHLLVFSAFLVLSGRVHHVAHQVLEDGFFSFGLGAPAHGKNASEDPLSSPGGAPPSPSPLPIPPEGAKPGETKKEPGPSAVKGPEAPGAGISPSAVPTTPSSGEKEVKKEEKKDSNAFDLLEMTPQEIQMLQTLADRRRLLETQEASFHQKSSELKATQYQIDKKITQLNELKETLKKLLDQYNDKDQQKNKNLAKIYENMKPKEAGRIFEILDMPLLLDIMESMKEGKISLILASMNPERAREITAQFMERRRMPPSPVLPPK